MENGNVALNLYCPRARQPAISASGMSFPWTASPKNPRKAATVRAAETPGGPGDVDHWTRVELEALATNTLRSRAMDLRDSLGIKTPLPSTTAQLVDWILTNQKATFCINMHQYEHMPAQGFKPDLDGTLLPDGSRWGSFNPGGAGFDDLVCCTHSTCCMHAVICMLRRCEGGDLHLGGY